MMARGLRRGAAACLAAAVAMAVGCSKVADNRAAIRGEVKLDGKPLESGSILFQPMAGTKGAAAGGEIQKGRYQLSQANGPALGWNRVEIRALRKSGKMVQKALAPKGEMVEHYEQAVHKKFNSESTLKIEVRPGENVADFEVTSP